MSPLALVLFLVPQGGEGPELPPPAPRWTASVGGVSRFFFATDVEDGPGDLALTQTGVGVRLGRALDRKRRLGLRLGYERSFYDFGGGGGVAGFPDPVDELNVTTVGASLVTRESADLSWLVTGFASAGFDDDADALDGITYGGGATVTWRISPKFLFTVGAFGNKRLEDDPLVYPWLQIDWQPTERLHIGREGSGVGVGYSWLDDVTAYLNFSFTERNYRLGDDAVVADGVLRDDEFAFNTGLRWNPDSPWSAELYGGVAYRELNLLDDDENELGDASIDAAPYVALRLSYAF